MIEFTKDEERMIVLKTQVGKALRDGGFKNMEYLEDGGFTFQQDGIDVTIHFKKKERAPVDEFYQSLARFCEPIY